MSLLIVRCPHCQKAHVMGDYTWAELVAECGGEAPICSDCGTDLTPPHDCEICGEFLPHGHTRELREAFDNLVNLQEEQRVGYRGDITPQVLEAEAQFIVLLNQEPS